MPDDARDREYLFEALCGVDVMFSQDHLHHAAPEGAQNKKRELKSDILIVFFMSHEKQPFFFCESSDWNSWKLWSCSYSRSPAVGGRHHPLAVDERASTEVVVHE